MDDWDEGEGIAMAELIIHSHAGEMIMSKRKYRAYTREFSLEALERRKNSSSAAVLLWTPATRQLPPAPRIAPGHSGSLVQVGASGAQP